MKFFADFHIHSHYSRATSSEMEIEKLAEWASLKGLELLGTGDFTHHLWFSELSRKLKEFAPGIYYYKNTKFILSAEVCCIFPKNGRTRKVHLLVLASSFEKAEKFNSQLSRFGSLSSDGRPILDLEAKNLVDLAYGVSSDFFIVPAHAWTPHFSVFGANSGFDSLEECFEEMTPHIKALETGLSSDPAMNWRLSALDKISLISNSDAHSPSKLGREANLFDVELSYPAIIKAITEKDPQKFLATVEFFPEEGKYHYDGHRDCGVVTSPEETKTLKGLCPRCKKRLTIGVAHRVEKLADRPEGFFPKRRIPYFRVVPLEELIAQALGQNPGTKAVEAEYHRLVTKAGREFYLLLEAPLEELNAAGEKITEAIKRVRNNQIKIAPGYDGVYGKIEIFPEISRLQETSRAEENSQVQMGLF
jgi:uncharacterized protein (TIGR00375 family)